MGMFMVREMPIRNEQNKIPDTVLANILKVYEFGKKKDLKKIPNEFICMRNGDFWTTWSKVFEMRDFLKRQKKNQERANY